MSSCVKVVKIFLLIGLAAVGLALAQGNAICEVSDKSDLSKGLPECAIPCINSAITSTGCQAVDVSSSQCLSDEIGSLFLYCTRFS
jgi:hypothetical protein